MQESAGGPVPALLRRPLDALSTTQLLDTALLGNINPWAMLERHRSREKRDIIEHHGSAGVLTLCSHTPRLPGCPDSVAALEEEQSSAAAKHQQIQSCQGCFPFLFYGGIHSCAVRKQDIHPATFAEE